MTQYLLHGRHAPSGVRAFQGVIIWNRTRKRDRDWKRIFERAKLRRPESEWLRVEAPQLRIVDPALCVRVDKALATRRASVLRSAKPIGRPETKQDAVLADGDPPLLVWREL